MPIGVQITLGPVFDLEAFIPEDLMKWRFRVVLPMELDISDFVFYRPNAEDYLKQRIMVSTPYLPISLMVLTSFRSTPTHSIPRRRSHS